MKIRFRIFALIAILVFLPLLFVSCGEQTETTETQGGDSSPLPKQTSSSGGVDVAVAPVDLSADASTWKFSISLDSQGESNDDLAEAAVLVGEGGKEFKATKYEGDPAGSGHREGTLEFEAISPRPSTVTMKIRGVGGVGERSFSWTLPAS